MYTDGSSTGEGVKYGGAGLCVLGGAEGTTARCAALGPLISNYAAELAGIGEALKEILALEKIKLEAAPSPGHAQARNPSKYVIFIDCQPALNAVSEWSRELMTAPYWSTIRALREMLGRARRGGVQVDLRWTPGHLVGWPNSPNDIADAQARKGTTISQQEGGESCPRIRIPLKVIKKLAKTNIWCTVVQRWWTAEATTGNKSGHALYAAHPKLTGKVPPVFATATWSRADQIILDRLRLNCCVDMRHINRIQGVPTWCSHPDCAYQRG